MLTKKWTTPQTRREAAGLAKRAGHRLETLEPRVLLAAYTFESLADLLEVPGIIHEVAPPTPPTPPNGVEAAGFGSAAAGLGDINGDGIGDFAVSAPGTFGTYDGPSDGPGDSTAIPGRVFLFSGADGTLLQTLEDGFVGFGAAIASPGDLTGDGVADLIVGSPSAFDGEAPPIEGGPGKAYVFSGADGTLVRELTSTDSFAGIRADRFGFSLAVLGDITGDGAAELLVGSPGAGHDDAGAVYLFSGSDGALLRTFSGEARDDRFGHAVIAAPTDGGPNVFIGAPGNDAAGEDAGRAYLYAADGGALLLTLTGEAAGDRFGTALGQGSGFNITEAVEVLLVGAPGHDFDGGPDSETQVDGGRIYRFLADTGELSEPGGAIWGIAGYHLGEAINPVGDVTGDRRIDLAFIAPGAPEISRIQINTVGASQGVGGIALFPAAFGVDLGSVVFGIGDIDGDGAADVLGGMPEEGRAVAVSSFLLSPRQRIVGGSGDGGFLFYSAAGSVNYAFIDGVYTPQGEIPGVMSDDMIFFVNNSRTIVGRLVVGTGDGFLVESTPFVVVGGVRTLLPDAAAEIVGGVTPVWERMQPAGLGNDGSIIFNERQDPTAAPSHLDRAWLFKDGTLTLLWTGTARDVNDSGAVVGTRRTADAAMVVTRTADGVVTEIAGLLPDSPLAIDGAGRVYGTAPGLALARWEVGTVTTLARPEQGPQSALPFSVIHDASDDGRVLARTTRIVGRSVITTDYIFTPEDGVREVSRLVYGTGGQPVSLGGLIRFGDDGRIFLNDSVLTPVDEAVVWSLAPGSPVSAVDGAVLGVSPLGDAVLLVRSGGVWAGSLVPTGFAGVAPNDDPVITGVTLMREGATGRYIAAVTADGETYLSRFSASGELIGQFILANDADATAIVAGATTFTTADGRLVLAGTDAAGDLVIYFQSQVPSATNPNVPWIYDNLRATHLDARGQAFTPVAGNLTGFSTPWGTDHIAYLDADGEVHAVWWAPGDPLWRTDQISTVEGSGTLTGTLTSFVTPWRTLHLNAFDGKGDLVAVWWAPGFGGQWATTALAPGAAKLDPATAASFHTPWNALNIAGLDLETGEPTVYWWAPATQEWRVEPVQLDGAPAGLALSGPVAAAVSAAGTQSLFARQDDGRIARLFWSLGDGAAWTYEDITASAAATA